MDPNEALKQIRDLCRETRGGWLTEAQSDRLAELIQGLDQWLSKGGFLPMDWTRAGENNRLIRPFDVLLCETCDTDREVASVIDGIIRFRVCGHVQP